MNERTVGERVTPRTEAGRRLLSAAAANETPVWSGPDMVALEKTILAIETEAIAAREADLAAADGWTALAKDIRLVDGNHDLGAGELAARLYERGWRRLIRGEEP